MRDQRVWVQLPDATIARFNELTRGIDARGAVASAPVVVTGPDWDASSGGGWLRLEAVSVRSPRSSGTSYLPFFSRCGQPGQQHGRR
jgi:hypothetical protein